MLQKQNKIKLRKHPKNLNKKDYNIYESPLLNLEYLNSLYLQELNLGLKSSTQNLNCFNRSSNSKGETPC